jgi:capsular exopolysaccharide synthesis family protein
MSRIDRALRFWEQSAGMERSERETTRSTGRTSLGQYAREAQGSTQLAEPLEPLPRSATPNVARPPSPATARPAHHRPHNGHARLVTEGLSAVSVEQYRRLAAALHDAQVEGGLKTVMLTSALPGEGKTLTTVNLALTLSESYARRVLVIDADLRGPSIHSSLGIANTRGLTEALTDEHVELPVVEVSERLYVLTAGRAGKTPLASLSSPRMAALLEGCAARFDWVLLDTPPVGVLPDAQLLARRAGAVLLVIGAGSTPGAVVERTIAELGQECILGTVLNRVEPHAIGEADYYDRYYNVSQ